MSGLVGGVAADTVLATLGFAVAGHLWHPGMLARALAEHRVVPAPGYAAAVVILAEAAVSGAGIVGVLRGDGLLTGLALGAAGLLFACYGGYAWYAVAAGRIGSCGCSRIEVPLTGWVAGRAFALAGLALLGAALAGSPVGPTAGVPLVVELLAAAVFTVLLWHLPVAMHDPAGPRRPVSHVGGSAG